MKSSFNSNLDQSDFWKKHNSLRGFREDQCLRGLHLFQFLGARTKTTFQDQTVVFAKIQVGTQRWCLARPLSLADNKRNTVTRPSDVYGAYLVVLELTGVKLKEWYLNIYKFLLKENFHPEIRATHLSRWNKTLLSGPEVWQCDCGRPCLFHHQPLETLKI